VEFLGGQICEQVSLLDVGAREQIWITTKLPKKAIFRDALIPKFIFNNTFMLHLLSQKSSQKSCCIS